MVSPGDGAGAYNGFVHNAMNLHSPIFIGAIVHDVNVTMVINQPDAENQTFRDMYGFSNGPIGWFTQPRTTVTQGDNWVTMDVPVHFNSTADNGFRFPSWAFYAWASGVVYIDLVAEPKLTALGFVTMKTKMKKQIACNCIAGSSPACQFPKDKPSAASTPSATYREDNHYFEPLPDNRTREPEPYNATHDQIQDFYYLPIMTLSCEPVGTPVYNGTDIMSTVSTTVEFGFAV